MPTHPPTRCGAGVADPRATGPPSPPPGPGVRPPFVAAPIEGRSTRMWVSLGVAGAVLVVCCGMGAVALGGLLVTLPQAQNEQAQQAVEAYLAAVVDEEYERAYELRCDADRAAESLTEFTRRVSGGPRIESYRIGDLETDLGEGPFDPEATGDMTVPVEVDYADGSEARLTVPVEQSSDTGEIEVCGLRAGP